VLISTFADVRLTGVDRQGVRVDDVILCVMLSCAPAGGAGEGPFAGEGEFVFAALVLSSDWLT
jgi:hypothetical protein